MKTVFLVYDHPPEYPDRYVVYREVHGVRDEDFLMLGKDLEVLQKILIVDMRLTLVEDLSLGDLGAGVLQKYIHDKGYIS